MPSLLEHAPGSSPTTPTTRSADGLAFSASSLDVMTPVESRVHLSSTFGYGLVESLRRTPSADRSPAPCRRSSSVFCAAAVPADRKRRTASTDDRPANAPLQISSVCSLDCNVDIRRSWFPSRPPPHAMHGCDDATRRQRAIRRTAEAAGTHVRVRIDAARSRPRVDCRLLTIYTCCRLIATCTSPPNPQAASRDAASVPHRPTPAGDAERRHRPAPDQFPLHAGAARTGAPNPRRRTCSAGAKLNEAADRRDAGRFARPGARGVPLARGVRSGATGEEPRRLRPPGQPRGSGRDL